MIRVLVVDDSVFMRTVISDIIKSDSELEVIGTARTGQEAILKAEELKPDVITMDIEMPVMSGLDALSKIDGIPVIMLSSHTRDGADLTMQALNLGAFDFITKPTSLAGMVKEDIKQELIEMIKEASKSKKISKSISQNIKNIKPTVSQSQELNHQKILYENKVQTSNNKTQSTVRRLSRGENSKIKKIVAIGISTGGPKALHELIPRISPQIPASILIVQHMPPNFTKSLAERLSACSQVKVKEAEDNEIIKAGCVYIAPGDRHLTLIKQNSDFVIKLIDGSKVSGHKPSADVMFESLSKVTDTEIVGVIMTGMGADGTLGLKQLDSKGHYIIAQDEESSVVFGMPGSAVKAGVVDKLVPLDDLATEIMKAVDK